MNTIISWPQADMMSLADAIRQVKYLSTLYHIRGKKQQTGPCKKVLVFSVTVCYNLQMIVIAEVCPFLGIS